MSTLDLTTSVFLQEAVDLLAQLEQAVLELEERPEIGEPLHRLFRVFHTFKGSAGAAGLGELASFGHEVESVLDRVRSGQVPISRRLIDVVLAAGDLSRQMLAVVSGGPPPDQALRARILSELAALMPAGEPPARGPGHAPLGAPGGRPVGAAVANLPADLAAAMADGEFGLFVDSLPSPETSTFSIGFTPDPQVMAKFVDPARILDELRALGQCEVEARLEAIPRLEALEPERCYLRWDIRLTTTVSLESLRDVFIFVENDSAITIEALPAPASNDAASPASPDSPPLPPPAGSAPPSSGPVAFGAGMAAPAAPPAPGAAPTAPVPPGASGGPRGKEAAGATVRVASDKLDRLIKLVGELVINQAQITEVARGLDSADLAEPVEALERLVGEMRDSVLGIRMMPIGATFNRFRRLVRDLSAELGKEVELQTEGEETELDKTVIDELGDPLVHLIRNSIDHGLEVPDVRRAQGKRPRGVLRLAATHQGSHVVITIQDDGRGLDAERIRAKAVERGLVSADARLTTGEIHNLIFAPGFSTAAKVTNVSGRGVGMDVVKRNVEALRGTVAVTSEPGRGATIRLTLPLTLAIIDGLLVEVSGERLIVPLAAVSENVELMDSERARNNGRNAIVVRGEMVPYLSLAEQFAFEPLPQKIRRIVIVNHQGERLGLLVDRVLGVHQTVIQKLGQAVGRIDVVSGATILGDGRVALILDLGSLFRRSAALAPSPLPGLEGGKGWGRQGNKELPT